MYMSEFLTQSRCKVMGFFIFHPNYFAFFKLKFWGCVVFLTSKEERRDVFCNFSPFSHSFTENLHLFTFCREGGVQGINARDPHPPRTAKAGQRGGGSSLKEKIEIDEKKGLCYGIMVINKQRQPCTKLENLMQGAESFVNCLYITKSVWFC